MAHHESAAARSPLPPDIVQARAETRAIVERGRKASEMNARQLALARETLASSRQLLASLRDPLRRLKEACTVHGKCGGDA